MGVLSTTRTSPSIRPFYRLHKMIKAACGSTVIYSGNRFAETKVYQIGEGVCAALLRKNGIPVISQRDFASLEILYSKLDVNHQINSEMINHADTAWYKEYFQ